MQLIAVVYSSFTVSDAGIPSREYFHMLVQTNFTSISKTIRHESIQILSNGLTVILNRFRKFVIAQINTKHTEISAGKRRIGLLLPNSSLQ